MCQCDSTLVDYENGGVDAILPAVRIPGDILSAFGDDPDWLVHVICVQETDDRHTVTMFDGSTNGSMGVQP